MVTLVFLEAVMYITVATVLLLIILKKKNKTKQCRISIVVLAKIL